jgi:hypothetical protein
MPPTPDFSELARKLRDLPDGGDLAALLKQALGLLSTEARHPWPDDPDIADPAVRRRIIAQAEKPGWFCVRVTPPPELRAFLAGGNPGGIDIDRLEKLVTDWVQEKHPLPPTLYYYLESDDPEDSDSPTPPLELWITRVPT